MPLLERASFLASLAQHAQEAREGEGRLVLVSGEAGVGKTALLEQFEADLPDAEWAWSACDGLFTPRPLGPLFDLAGSLGDPLLAAATAGADRDALFATLLRQLAAGPRLRVVVVEDVHWADEATLDLLRFLARRLRDLPVLLIATFRDDGLAPDHPLRVVLGFLASLRTTRRLALPALSETAVDELAAAFPVVPGELFRLTGGNPFFVTEVLAAGEQSLPLSAREAVLARVARLDAGARQLLEYAALAGSRVEPGLLEQVVPDAAAGEEACLAGGVLTADEVGLRFRHEISRLAVAEAVPSHRRGRMHADLLEALHATASEDDARLAHHAEGAGNAVAVLLHAPRAARKAAALASHREAVAQYERALRFASHLDPAAQAALWDGLGYETSLVDRWADSAAARRAALPLWRWVGDRRREGDSLRGLSRALYRLCQGTEAEEAAQEALAVLSELAPAGDPELAWAYANLAVQRMLHRRLESSIALARQGQALAERLGDRTILSDALDSEACALAFSGQEWLPTLLRALDVALAADREEQAGRAYANLHGLFCAQRRYAEADRWFTEGVAFCDDHDVATFGTCLRGERTNWLDQQGRWDEAVELAASMLSNPGVSPVNRLNPLISLGRIRSRRGDPQAQQLLDEAALLADGTGEPDWIALARLARTEAAWLTDRPQEAADELARVVEVADRCDPWVRGAVAVWRRRLGHPGEVPAELPEPRARELAGDARGAAAAWRSVGSPYEAALTLADSDDEAALREALAVFDELGALVPARRTRRLMRRRGLTGVPAGPRSATRTHRLGLTSREQEVLALVAAGLPNGDISRQLFISQRTVDHHVSALLAKMGVASRSAAAREAARLGLLGGTSA